MKLASIHGMRLKSLFHEHAPAASPRHDPPRITDVVDDSYSEAINFQFEASGQVHRGLVTYDALHECVAEEEAEAALTDKEPAMALFIRHAEEIGETAAAKLEKEGIEPVVLADGDL